MKGMDVPVSAEQPVEPASTQYEDLTGTVAADHVYGDDVYTLTGIDRDTWLITGYELSLYGESREITILAANMAELGVSSNEDWSRVTEENGEIPLTEFALPDSVDLEDFIRAAFRRFHTVLTLRGFNEYPLVVRTKDDLPFGEHPQNT